MGCHFGIAALCDIIKGCFPILGVVRGRKWNKQIKEKKQISNFCWSRNSGTVFKPRQSGNCTIFHSPIWCSVFHQHTWKHSTWPVKAEGKHSTGHAPYLPSAVFTLRTLSGKKMKLPVNNYTSHLCHTPRFTQILQTTTSITGGEQEESRSLWQRKFKSRQHVRPCTHSLTLTHAHTHSFTYSLPAPFQLLPE